LIFDNKLKNEDEMNIMEANDIDNENLVQVK